MQAFLEAVAGLLLFALLLGGVAKLDDIGRGIACDKYAAATGEVVKHVKWDRCYVQTPSGKWRALDQLRNVED